MANRIYVVTLGDEEEWDLVDTHDEVVPGYCPAGSKGIRAFWKRNAFGDAPSVLGVFRSHEEAKACQAKEQAKYGVPYPAKYPAEGFHIPPEALGNQDQDLEFEEPPVQRDVKITVASAPQSQTQVWVLLEGKGRHALYTPRDPVVYLSAEAAHKAAFTEFLRFVNAAGKKGSSFQLDINLPSRDAFGGSFQRPSLCAGFPEDGYPEPVVVVQEHSIKKRRKGAPTAKKSTKKSKTTAKGISKPAKKSANTSKKARTSAKKTAE